MKRRERNTPAIICPHSNQEEHRLYKSLILEGCSDREAWDVIREAKREVEHPWIPEPPRPDLQAFIDMAKAMDAADIRRSAVIRMDARSTEEYTRMIGETRYGIPT